MIGETMAQFVARRGRERANFGRAAEAAAHEAYRRAIRLGEDLRLPTAGEVMAYGAALRRGLKPGSSSDAGALRKPRPTVAEPAAGEQPTASRVGRRPQQEDRLDRSPTARKVAGKLAEGAGRAVGTVRGAWHAAEGLGEGAVFLGRLVDPSFDRLVSPDESAPEQLMDAGRAVMDYAREALGEPRRVLRDIEAKARQMHMDLDPRATPPAPTFAGELRRRFDIGQNQGELLFDAATLTVGGPMAKSFKGLGAVSRGATAERYLAQGFSPAAAAHLAEPYSGRGHHFIPQRAKVSLPREYREGPFNVLRPDDITRGEFYELHYAVDPRFSGATLMPGEPWKGNALELERYGPIRRIWHGSPAPLRARVGGLGAASGGLAHDISEEDEAW